jgi:hypothetical protein
LADPFVVAEPKGARVRTRLRVAAEDVVVLVAVGQQLGGLAGADLAARCRSGRRDAKGGAGSRTPRKQALTDACSSRWAGAITRTSEDAWSLAERNLEEEARSLRARIGRIRRRLAVPVGARRAVSAAMPAGRNGGRNSAAFRCCSTASSRSTPAWPTAGSRCAEAGAGWPRSATI